MLKKVIFFAAFILIAISIFFTYCHLKDNESFSTIYGAWEQTDDFNLYYFISPDSILIEGVSSIRVISNNTNRVTDKVTIFAEDSIQLSIGNSKSIILRKITDTVIIPSTNRGIINIDTVDNMQCLGYKYNGRQHGIWVCTNFDGKIKNLTRWYNGEKNGTELRYSNDSTIISEEFYRNSLLLYSKDFNRSRNKK